MTISHRQGMEGRCNALHITNTDVLKDSRILKELNALHELIGFSSIACGVGPARQSSSVELWGTYVPLSLFSRRLSRLPRGVRYIVEMLEFTAKAVRRGLRARPHIVHCHDAFALPAGWIVSKWCGAKLIYDAHELAADKAGQSWLLSKCTILIESVCWSRIDALICVSDSIGRWYQQRLGRRLTETVLNAPEIRAPRERCSASAGPASLREWFGIGETDLLFTYVGALEPGRGIEIFLEALGRVECGAHLVFVGSGSLEEHIRRVAETNERVYWHPPVPHHEVTSLISSASFGLCLIENVSLSDYLCLPNKLFEYIFAGVPVIASDFPEIARVVRQGKYGYCLPPEPDALEVLLRHLCSGEAKFRIGAFSESLSWSAQAQKLSSLYHRLLPPTGAMTGALGAPRPGLGLTEQSD